MNRFVATFGAWLALTSWLDPASAATPSTVPFSAAPKKLPSRELPVCMGSDVVGLPNRAAFERTTPPPMVPRPTPYWREPVRYASPSSNPYASLHQESVGVQPSQHGLTFVHAFTLPDGRLFWYIAINRGDSPLPLRVFVTTFRTELGFRDGDWPEQVGDRVYRRYANGAISLHYLTDHDPEGPRADTRPRPPSLGYSGLLPAPADGLASPPDLSGTEALAIVHDMNPYLELVPLEEPGAPVAARLVVVSGIDWDPRLAWEVRYRFGCWKLGPGDERPVRSDDTAYAYVDARSGALVFGRDVTRGGVALYGPSTGAPALAPPFSKAAEKTGPGPREPTVDLRE